MTSLVSVAEVSARCAVAASRDADDVQLIIDANEQLMIGRLATAGVTEGNVSFFMRGYPASVLLLPYRMASISSVVEHWLFRDHANDLTLATNDWRLAPDGTAIERLFDGTNPRDTFADEITITGVSYVTLALRKNVLIQLACLDVSAGGDVNVRSQRLGDYSETRSGAGGGGLTQDKEEILQQLIPPLPLFS